jgi:hypothetical protein
MKAVISGFAALLAVGSVGVAPASPQGTAVSIDRSAAATALAQRQPPSFTGSPTIGGCPVFPPSSPWNTDISRAPLHPNSAAIVNRLNAIGGRSVTVDAGRTNTSGFPIAIVPQGQPLVPITYALYGHESDPGPFPIPLDAPVEPIADAHVLVVRPGTCELFELYRARRSANGWIADSGARWNLREDGRRPRYWTSADAAGLPILPGLPRCDEIEAGAIRHAIRTTVVQTRRAFIDPASHYASSSTSPDLPPMGMRFRLKASYDISGFTGSARVIAQALKTYGLIVADNGPNWNIKAVPGPCWNGDVYQLTGIPGSAFEAVDTGPAITGP